MGPGSGLHPGSLPERALTEPWAFMFSPGLVPRLREPVWISTVPGTSLTTEPTPPRGAQMAPPLILGSGRWSSGHRCFTDLFGLSWGDV